MEGYHWGRFTSGSWSQALWLVLMPFGLVNAAQFMLDPPSTTVAKAGHAVAGAMLRLIGLALTVLIVLCAAVAAMDLWAWQFVGPREGFAAFPYDLVPLAALLAPAAALLVCNFLGRARLVGGRDEDDAEPSVRKQRDDRLRHVPDAAGAGMPGEFWTQDLPSDLARPGFFGGDPDAPALRLLHIAAGLLVLAALGYAPAGPAPDVAPPWALGLTLAVLAVVVLVVVLLGDPEESASVDVGPGRLKRLKDLFHKRADLLATVLAGVGGAAFVLAAVRVTALPPVPAGEPHWPGIDAAVFAALCAGIGGLAVLAVANVVVLYEERRSRARENPDFAPYAGGFAATLVTALGLFVGVGYTGAFATAAAQLLDTWGGGSGGGSVRVPELFSRIVHSWGVTTALIVLVAAVGALVWRAQRSGFLERAREQYLRDGEQDPRVPKRWLGHIAFGMWKARLKTHLVGPLALFTGVGALLSAFTVAELWPQLWGGQPQRLPGWLDALSQSQSYGGPATGWCSGPGRSRSPGWPARS
ncbi:hypothetical protein BJF78_02615 [Pseudonocardia sp. CNS-139]|nr:hypothetical protein BJF78_02615 [Pseudonocardia sp. CNS-139]